jgi:ABC-type phosphate/phosphonate transport system substrate-binding protein
MPQELIANARMYSVAPGAAAAWKRLFVWAAETSGVRLDIIDHAFPALLNDLWRRPDLAATFMCGWPYLRLNLGHQVLAAPVPSAAWAGGKPVYCTHFVVRKDAPFQRLEDTFGHRFAFTISDSHSGYNAPRRHLMRYRTAGGPLYREIVGPLTTPRRMLEAIVDGRTDVGPLDSFAFALLERHEPDLVAPVRVLASTDTVPIPSLMASQGMDPAVIERLRGAVLSVGARPELADVRRDLCIAGFARLDPAVYELTERWAREAEAAGLSVIA